MDNTQIIRAFMTLFVTAPIGLAPLAMAIRRDMTPQSGRRIGWRGAVHAAMRPALSGAAGESIRRVIDRFETAGQN